MHMCRGVRRKRMPEERREWRSNRAAQQRLKVGCEHVRTDCRCFGQCDTWCLLCTRAQDMQARLSTGCYTCTLQDAVQAVVQFLWADNREVPLIAAYHKDAAGELLSMRRDVSGYVSCAFTPFLKSLC